jgi:hypothetical protein
MFPWGGQAILVEMVSAKRIAHDSDDIHWNRPPDGLLLKPRLDSRGVELRVMPQADGRAGTGLPGIKVAGVKDGCESQPPGGESEGRNGAANGWRNESKSSSPFNPLDLAALDRFSV